MKNRLSDLRPACLTEIAGGLLRRITKLKPEGTRGFEWYPYDSLASVPRIVRLLDAVKIPLLDSALADGVVDVGCGDGEISFLFEQLGCHVTALDCPVTNHNGMKGVHALKRLLDSTVEIIEVDLDEHSPPFTRQRGLALCLGLIYHLKNPFFTLEHVARYARYCLLSTRVASHFPDGTPLPAGQPIAYLVDTNELNADETNYWIFSQTGLNRMLKRAHWEVLALFSAGNTDRSDPVNPDRDERIFCLLKSHYGLANIDLLDGWHEVEGPGWRWTKRAFSFHGNFESSYIPKILKMRIFLPPEVLRKIGPQTLAGSMNGNALPPIQLTVPGEHTYEVRLRTAEQSLTFGFELDKFNPPSSADSRELGIIVASVDFK